jgi:hypothetical protein
MTTRVVLIMLAIACLGGARSGPDINRIIQQSAQVSQADQKASVNYDHSETDLESDGSRKTYSVHMLFGSPYRELIAVNQEPLSKDEQEREHHKLADEISRRQRESQDQRAHRVGEFQKEQTRDQRLLEEFTKAFDFKLLGEQQLDHRQVYLLQATPRASYRPPNRESEVLTGMHGQLWIDKKTFQWVKVEAEVIRPVSIVAFLAKVEPGTRFELEKMPVEGEIWLAKHFSMSSKAKVLSVIPHTKQEDETYFNYHRAAPFSEIRRAGETPDLLAFRGLVSFPPR